MKKLLTAIATTATVTFAGIIAAPAARALPSFGEVLGDGLGDYYSDLSLLNSGDAELTSDELDLIENSSMALNLDFDPLDLSSSQLLSNPSTFSTMYTGLNVQTDMVSGIGTISYNGCSVNTGCALSAIGFSLSMQCAGSGTNPKAWADCIAEKDSTAYVNALKCTWQINSPGETCDFKGLATSGHKVVACNKSANPVVAGKVLLNLPPTLSQGKEESLQIGLLSEG